MKTILSTRPQFANFHSTAISNIISVFPVKAVSSLMANTTTSSVPSIGAGTEEALKKNFFSIQERNHKNLH